MIEELGGKKPGKDLEKPPRREGTEMIPAVPHELSFQVLADKFIDAFDTNLGTPQIIQQMIKAGFPAGLVADLGEGFSNFIEDAKKKLAAIDPSEPELAEALRQSVSRKMTEYFGSQRPTIERFFAVSQNPAQYLQTIASVLSNDSEILSKLPEGDFMKLLSNVRLMDQRVILSILNVAAQRIGNAVRLPEDCKFTKSEISQHGNYVEFKIGLGVTGKVIDQATRNEIRATVIHFVRTHFEDIVISNKTYESSVGLGESLEFKLMYEWEASELEGHEYEDWFPRK